MPVTQSGYAKEEERTMGNSPSSMRQFAESQARVKQELDRRNAAAAQNCQCPVTQAAPSGNEIQLAQCLREIAMNSLAGGVACWQGASKDVRVQLACQVANVLMTTIVNWYGNDKCPSQAVMYQALKDRVEQWSFDANTYPLAPYLFAMPPCQWPWGNPYGSTPANGPW